jgi:hypothetical protein
MMFASSGKGAGMALDRFAKHRAIARAEMRPHEKLVLYTLWDFENARTGVAWPTIPTISAVTGLSARAVSYALKGLHARGVLTGEQRMNRPRIRAINYEALSLGPQVKFSESQRVAEDPPTGLNEGAPGQVGVHTVHGERSSPPSVESLTETPWLSDEQIGRRGVHHVQSGVHGVQGTLHHMRSNRKGSEEEKKKEHDHTRFFACEERPKATDPGVEAMLNELLPGALTESVRGPRWPSTLQAAAQPTPEAVPEPVPSPAPQPAPRPPVDEKTARLAAELERLREAHRRARGEE